MSQSEKNLEKHVLQAFRYVSLHPEKRKNTSRSISKFKEKHGDSPIMIPRFLFNKVLKTKKLRLTANTFSRNYSNYFIKAENGKNYVEFSKAFRLMNELWKRKDLIEHGKRLDDLNNELSLGKKYDTLLKRYIGLHNEGHITLHLLPKLIRGKTPRESSSYVFEPQDYDKAVVFELREQILQNMYESGEIISTKDFADLKGITRIHAGRIIRQAANMGVVEMYELRSLAGNVLQTYVSQDSVDVLLKGGFFAKPSYDSDFTDIDSLNSDDFPALSELDSATIDILKKYQLISSRVSSQKKNSDIDIFDLVKILEKNNVPLVYIGHKENHSLFTSWRDGKFYKPIAQSFVDMYSSSLSFKQEMDELINYRSEK